MRRGAKWGGGAEALNVYVSPKINPGNCLGCLLGSAGHAYTHMTAPHSIEVEAEEWNLWYCSIIVVFSAAKIGKMAGLHVQSLYSSKIQSPC